MRIPRPLRRIARYAVAGLAVVALVLILFQPVRPHCGLPGYPMGPELDPAFSTEVLRGLHALAEAGDGSFSGVFLLLGRQLYLLPWERYGSSLPRAVDLAFLTLAEHNQRVLPGVGIVARWYALRDSAGPDDPQTRAVRCRTMQVFAKPDRRWQADDR